MRLGRFENEYEKADIWQGVADEQFIHVQKSEKNISLRNRGSKKRWGFSLVERKICLNDKNSIASCMAPLDPVVLWFIDGTENISINY